MRRYLCLLAPAVTLVVGTSAAARAATITAGTAIAISPTEFALPIQIAGAVELSAWEFGLSYDPTDVQIDTACDPFADTFCSLTTGFTTEGGFFAAGAPFNLLNPGIVVLDPILLTQIGLLSAVQGAYGGVPPAPSGDGVIAYVRFLIVGTGDSPIDVVDPSVTENVIPEPSSVWLVTIGLPLALRRLRRPRGR
jgi:hypothetical protein